MWKANTTYSYTINQQSGICHLGLFYIPLLAIKCVYKKKPLENMTLILQFQYCLVAMTILIIIDQKLKTKSQWKSLPI